MLPIQLTIINAIEVLIEFHTDKADYLITSLNGDYNAIATFLTMNTRRPKLICKLDLKLHKTFKIFLIMICKKHI